MDHRDLKAGQRVRIIIEDDVVGVGNSWLGINCGDLYLNEDSENPVVHVVSIEVIKPPAVQFGPGDVVENNWGTRYALVHDGYIIVKSDTGLVGTHVKYGPMISTKPTHWNSDNCRKVN